MNPETELILTKIDNLQSDFNNFARKCEGRFSALETDNYAVMGNGQPGRISKIEEDVSALQRIRFWLIGAVAGVSSIGPAIGWVILHFHLF